MISEEGDANRRKKNAHKLGRGNKVNLKEVTFFGARHIRENPQTQVADDSGPRGEGSKEYTCLNRRYKLAQVTESHSMIRMFLENKHH